MGVPGLWEILNKVGTSTSWVRLAVLDGFEKNISKRRAYRMGIDASIWFKHATCSKGGENPETRALFFRLIQLANHPIIPLFVFDGRERPKIKRGSKKGKSGNHPRERDFKTLLDAFGMEWREARGEAEAELAYLNQNGYIDAIITDDCDAFLFGASTILKNISSNLSGNKNNLAKNTADKTDKYHSMLYRAEDIRNDPTVALSRPGMILFALLSGGDYHKGVEKVGKKIAHGLARCGFGEQLLEAYENLGNYKEEFDQFLQQWRAQVNFELKENRQGHLPHRTSLILPNNFPDLDVLEYYAKPINSGTGHDQGLGSIAIRDQKNLDLPKIAHLCEKYFEWGYRARILERFRNLLWPCAVMHVLRRTALEVDQRTQNVTTSSQSDIGTPPSSVKKYLGNVNRLDQYDDLFVNRGSAHIAQPAQSTSDIDPLISKIVNKREHPSTGKLLEYRVEISPAQLVQIASAGIKGTRAEPPSDMGKKVTNPTDLVRLWIPASVLSVAHPSMIKQYLDKDKDKARKGSGKGKARALEVSPDPSSGEENFPTTSQSHSNLGWDYPSDTGEKISLDPWFTSSSNSPSISPERPRCSGFFFTLPNPDKELTISDQEDEESEGFRTAGRNNDGDSDLEVNRPLTKLDRIVKNIVAPRKQDKRKRAQTVAKSQKSQTFDTTLDRPTKRQKTSSRVIDTLLDNGFL